MGWLTFWPDSWPIPADPFTIQLGSGDEALVTASPRDHNGYVMLRPVKK